MEALNESLALIELVRSDTQLRRSIYEGLFEDAFEQVLFDLRDVGEHEEFTPRFKEAVTESLLNTATPIDALIQLYNDGWPSSSSTLMGLEDIIRRSELLHTQAFNARAKSSGYTGPLPKPLVLKVRNYFKISVLAFQPPDLIDHCQFAGVYLIDGTPLTDASGHPDVQVFDWFEIEKIRGGYDDSQVISKLQLIYELKSNDRSISDIEDDSAFDEFLRKVGQLSIFSNSDT